ncbi:hypothetical protein CCR75_007222 [Bremia lactucae]|uniref:Uncharacterized protein n=1 Tax=Bremia lactucae TaxID=4779 RepID=A0A976FFB7_BRELC|nr:hypothetical protein CCR75_007222 [Bremia lactucae]
MADFDHGFALDEYVNSSPAAAPVPAPPRDRAVDEKEEKSKVEGDPRMNLDSLTGDPERNVKSRPGYGVHIFTVRFYIAADGGVADVRGTQGNGGAVMDMPGPALHGMQAAYSYPDA